MIYWGANSDATIWPKQGGKAIFHSGSTGCLDRCARYLLKPFDSRLEEQCSFSTQAGKAMGAMGSSTYLILIFLIVIVMLLAF